MSFDLFVTRPDTRAGRTSTISDTQVLAIAGGLEAGLTYTKVAALAKVSVSSVSNFNKLGDGSLRRRYSALVNQA